MRLKSTDASSSATPTSIVNLFEQACNASSIESLNISFDPFYKSGFASFNTLY